MKRALAVVAAAAAALVAAAAALAATVVVAPGHMGGWAVDNDTCGAATTGSVAFVTGPGTPPAGTGSVQLTVGANGDSYPTVRNGDYSGTKLSSLTALDYWTYVSHAGSGNQAAYLDLYVDNNKDGVKDDILTFEPVYQSSGTIALNTWQHWDALSGQWWSDAAGGPPPFFTLASYAAAHPDAAIVNAGGGGVILAAGCGGAAWTGFAGNADKLTIGVSGSSTTFDFEPAAAPPTGEPPKNKDQCKNGGWRNFTNPTFKNQGQCVAYVNHHDGKGADDDHAGKNADKGKQGKSGKHK
jgi:hypothetical protein